MQETRKLTRHNCLLQECKMGNFPEDSMTVYLQLSRENQNNHVWELAQAHPDIDEITCYEFN